MSVLRLEQDQRIVPAQCQRVESPASMALLQIIQGFCVSRALWVTVELGIPDLLTHGPTASEELAQATRVTPLLFTVC
jgi:hypothetical protein